MEKALKLCMLSSWQDGFVLSGGNFRPVAAETSQGFCEATRSRNRLLLLALPSHISLPNKIGVG